MTENKIENDLQYQTATKFPEIPDLSQTLNFD